MSNFMSICAAKERECEELKLRVAQLAFLYGEATAQLETAKRNRGKNKNKNVKCACGGITSSVPSIAKTHEQTQKHQRSLCQFIDDKEDESVISVSGSDASVFDDDVSVLAMDDGESIQATRHLYSELPVSVSPISSFVKKEEEEEEEVFQDASAKMPTKYNKARYESASRACFCGGRTSSIKSRAKIHENSVNHQKYIDETRCELSSIE